VSEAVRSNHKSSNQSVDNPTYTWAINQSQNECLRSETSPTHLPTSNLLPTEHERQISSHLHRLLGFPARAALVVQARSVVQSVLVTSSLQLQSDELVSMCVQRSFSRARPQGVVSGPAVFWLRSRSCAGSACGQGKAMLGSSSHLQVRISGCKFQTAGSSESCHHVCFPRKSAIAQKLHRVSKVVLTVSKKTARIMPRASANRRRPRHHQHRKPHAEHHPSDHGADHGREIYPQRSCPAKVASQAEPQKKHEG
jgi:hypothetical protein